MAYIRLYKGMTVSASDFNNNFYHIAQGNMLPLGNADLEATTGVYDLGSDTYKWNNVHVQNIEISGEMQKCMNLIQEVTLSATSSSIEFTGLNGDVDEIYEIICNIKGYAAGVMRMYPNSDSQTNNYGRQYLYAADTLITAARLLSVTGFFIAYTGDTSTAIYSKAKLILYANNTPKLSLFQRNRSIGETYINSIYNDGQVWNNSATLTSMKFTGTFDVGTNIQIWAKR